MKRYTLLTAFLILKIFLIETVTHAQIITDTTWTFPELTGTYYFHLYDYSKMRDTVIVECGALNYPLGNKFVKGLKLTSTHDSYFAQREITIVNGQLQKIFIIDTNMGITYTYLYDNAGLKKFEEGSCQATNAPHFFCSY